MIEFRLPSLGADMEEGTLLEWHVRVGDAVKRGQIVAVVDTSKAAIDLECWHDGTVAELVTRIGETIPVGVVMARLAAPGEAVAAPAPSLPHVAAEVPAAMAAAPMVVAPVPAPAPIPGGPPPVIPAPAPSQRRPVSPAARKHAREHGIDIDAVTGTGPHGAVTVADVEARAAAPVAADPPTATPAPIPAAAATPAAPAQRLAPARDRSAGMRQAIAAAMARSKREIPHYYLSERIPMAHALAWLAATNAARPIAQRLLPVVLQVKAVALALGKVPDLNGTWRDGAFVPAAAVHLGVAISLRQGGLIAPALHDVQAKPLDQLMRELNDLVRRARAGSLRSSEIADPTVTLTNLGDQGVESVFGVIYPPQVALIGLGSIAEQPWAEDGGLKVIPAVMASLAADHRVSDGHRGALFLRELRERLQHPEDL